MYLELCIQGEIVHWGKTCVRGHVEASGWTVGRGERVDRERKQTVEANLNVQAGRTDL